MRWFYCIVVSFFLVIISLTVVCSEEACSIEVMSRHGFEGEGVVHVGEYADIFLIYPGKTGRDIERVQIKIDSLTRSVGMLDLLFNSFDQPVGITSFKVTSDPGEIHLSYVVLLPPKEGEEEPQVGCSGSKSLKVVKAKRF